MSDRSENKPNDASAASPLPKTPKRRRAAEPIEPVSPGFSSFALSTREPKPTHMPDLPPYYANDLKPQTEIILVEAVRKFPNQTQTLEMCRYIFAKLTPHFHAAVLCGTVRADLALSDSKELLGSVLGCRNARRLDSEVRKSDEWLGLVKAIAESLSAQSGANSAQNVKSKGTPEKAALVDRRASIAIKIQRTPNGMLTTGEAAIHFCVKPKTIRAWINGEVKNKKLASGVKRGTVTIESILRLEKNLQSASKE